MKRHIISLLSCLCVAVAMAIPAHQRSLSIGQPDGTAVTIRLHGDEYRHYYTTTDGYSVVKNRQGFYVYARLGSDGKLEPSAMVAHDEHERSLSEISFLGGMQKHIMPAKSEMSLANKNMQEKTGWGTKKAKVVAKAGATAGAYSSTEYARIPVILIEFNDKSFSLSDYKSVAEGLFSTENYGGYTDKDGNFVECTGSVRDYFADNSGGVYTPEFDVFGPYKVNYSQYDPEGTDNAQEILLAAISMADSDINFKNYDGDGDGMVDAIYFVVAGNGANFSGNDQRLFWPHQSWLVNWRLNGSYSLIYKDGVALGKYASGVELYGFTSDPSTVVIDGIGTICHEFSHVLGLPDFYDTDYEDSGGESITPGKWSVMDSGSYLNSGRTPIGYSLFERFLLGFTSPQEISAAGSYELVDIATSNNGYYMLTPNGEKEFFMFENRQKDDKWNQYAPGHGMLVFRIDYTSDDPWNNWAINTNPNHNYYELLRADGYKGKDAGTDPFPGTKGVTQLSSTTSPAHLRTWNGKDCEWHIENITESDGKITFAVANSDNQVLVTDISLSQTVATLTAGTTLLLTATVSPENAADKTVSWKSADNNVAVVSDDGLVTALAVGETVITCRANDGSGVWAACEVTVTEPASYPDPYYISMVCKNDNPLGITANDELVLTATFGNNGSAGIVKTMPVVIAKDGDLNLSDLKLDKKSNMEQTVPGIANLTIVKAGEIARTYFETSQNTTVNHILSMTDIPEGDYYATVLFYKESDNEDEAGWHCNISQLVDIAVGQTPVVEYIKLSQATAIMNVDDTLQLSVMVWPENAGSVSVNWMTSNQDIVTVSNTGLVTAIAEGTAAIICSTNDGSGLIDSCTVTVLPAAPPFIKGDVNGDSVVTGTDLVALTNIIQGRSENRPAADVNQDGQVNGTDYVALVNIILTRMATDTSTEHFSTSSALQLNPFDIAAGETKELTVSLQNPDDALTLLQFDLTLPEGLSIQKNAYDYQADMAGRTSKSSHQLSVHGNGASLRFLLASPGNTLIEGTEGAVIRIAVSASACFAGGTISLHDILGVSPDEREIRMSAKHYDMANSTTGICPLTGSKALPAVYNLYGQKVTRMKSGINIVDGKKILRK